MLSLDELMFTLGHAETLPQLPDSPLKLAQLIESGDPNPSQIESLILADPALTAGIIKNANSALFARAKPVTTIREAVAVLGHRSLRALAIACWTNALGQIRGKSQHLTPQRFAQNGNAVANLAASLAREKCAKSPWNQEELMAAGTLHNVMFGLLSYVDGNTYDQIYLEARSSGSTVDWLFEEHYGIPIAHLAPQAAATLGLPGLFVQTVSASSLPVEAQDEGQACLTTAKAVAEAGRFGLGDWPVPLNNTALPIEESEVTGLLKSALAQPGLLAA